MVHLFGILNPGRPARNEIDEAPARARVFTGLPDAALGAVPLSRAEQDACFLDGSGAELEDAARSPQVRTRER